MTSSAASSPTKIVVATFPAEKVDEPARGRWPKCAPLGGRRETHVGRGNGHAGVGCRSAWGADGRRTAADDSEFRHVMLRSKVKEVVRAAKAVSLSDQQLIVKHPCTRYWIPDHCSEYKALQPKELFIDVHSVMTP